MFMWANYIELWVFDLRYYSPVLERLTWPHTLSMEFNLLFSIWFDSTGDQRCRPETHLKQTFRSYFETYAFRPNSHVCRLECLQEC